MTAIKGHGFNKDSDEATCFEAIARDAHHSKSITSTGHCLVSNGIVKSLGKDARLS